MSGYDAAMRRVLIGLTVTVLLVVSIGVGVAVARWPCPHLWR
jgi:hypothetical protein